jgi:hypothetical protein
MGKKKVGGGGGGGENHHNNNNNTRKVVIKRERVEKLEKLNLLKSQNSEWKIKVWSRGRSDLLYKREKERGEGGVMMSHHPVTGFFSF